MDLLMLIDGWADRFPDKIACVSGEKTLTYGQLRRQSDALAAHLRARLPPDRTPVAILGHKEPEMLVGFLAAVKAGHPYLPLDISIPAQRVQRILESADIALTLTPPEIAELSQSGAVPLTRRKMEPDDPFYIIFTSGSTGEPKGVVITHGCLTHFLRWLTAEQRFAEGSEVFLNQAPFSFDLSVMDLFGALSTGGALFSVRREWREDPAQLPARLAASGVTVWVSTPSFAQLCLFNESFSSAILPHLRKFLFCGEVLAPETAAQLLDRFPAAEVWNFYGPTETTVAVTSVRIQKTMLAAGETLPVGRAMPGARIVTLDENGQPTPEGARGEISIGGPMVSPGYLGRPDLTERAFYQLDGQRAYRTGDYGRRRDGMLFFDGRMDGQVKIRGYRIELGEIESALREHPALRDAAVLATESAGEKRLVAYVVAAAPPPARVLRAFLRQRLPDYMVPAHFVPVAALPLTANGKLDRRALPLPASAMEQLPTAPTNPTQGRLVEMWEHILGVSPIGIDDDFFDLGGHSLLAVELVTEIEKTFGRTVSLSILFKAPTIEQLAVALSVLPRTERLSVIEEIRARGSRPPFFCVPGFLDLARHLGEDQPCYGVHLTELEAMPETSTAVEDLAARCAAEIRALQPRGPYYLGGHSFGGVVAFAIAQHFRAAQEEVALLALIDPDPPQPYSTKSFGYHLSRYLFQIRKILQLPAEHRLPYLQRSFRIERARFATKLRSFGNPAERDAADRDRAIASGYRAQLYPGVITLFFARDTHLRQTPKDDPRLEWGAVAAGGLKIHELPGDHYTLIREPNVRRLAEQLRAALDAARAPLAIALCSLTLLPDFPF